MQGNFRGFYSRFDRRKGCVIKAMNGTQMNRGLKNRHLQMISLGGIIDSLRLMPSGSVRSTATRALGVPAAPIALPLALQRTDSHCRSSPSVPIRCARYRVAVWIALPLGLSVPSARNFEEPKMCTKFAKTTIGSCIPSEVSRILLPKM